ncbi:MAG: CatB-related O-acetyltransferase [Rhodocyclaceae bacterium]|jgi:virginiamycin A acetyltransferase|nr:2,3,4,5-tetrahydropyridine-2,6-dicarboxylate N-acetyltransferase [Rhodocyclaceae bacterium]MCL4680688.1 CatB-related O-acetyltransferase [Rhodocyclaceae bacterium]
MTAVKFETLFAILAVDLLLRVTSFRYAGAVIGRGSWIKSRMEIGAGSGIGWNFCVRGSGRLVIGKHCAIGENVRIITSNHEYDCLALNFRLQSKVIGRRLIGKRTDVTIGHDVWIGDQAIILPGVSIGNGAIIGAGAVVTRPVEPFTIVAGNPAVPIRKRFSQKTIEEIARLAWWDWSLREMREKKELFEKRNL